MEVASDIEILLQQGKVFSRLSEALRSHLTSSWNGKSEEAVQEVLNLLFEGEGDLSPREIEQIDDLLEDILGAEFASEVQPVVQEGTNIAYEAGQQTMRVNTGGAFNPTDRRAMRTLREHNMYWVREHYDRFSRSLVQDAGEKVLREGLGRFEAGRFFGARLGKIFRGGVADDLTMSTEKYWELVSHNVTRRSSEISRVEGFSKAGAKEVLVDATLDRRTSCVCRYLDGERYSLEELKAGRASLLGAESPLEVKEASPWVSCAELKSMSRAQRIARGIILPPYHGFCRSVLRVPLPEDNA